MGDVIYVPFPQWTPGKKRAIPQATRRAVALRAGCKPLGTKVTRCHYCAAKGKVNWLTDSWVIFKGLELDHLVPEYLGGDGSPENIVLACRPCNRSKGWRRTAAEMGARI